LFLRCFDFLRSGFVIPDQTQESILAWQGLAWCGKARQGKARQGKARQGKARQGKARQGVVLFNRAMVFNLLWRMM
jgi:hypothetical protein